MFEEDGDALFDVFDSEVPISEFTNGELSSGTDHTAEKQKNLSKQNNHSRDQSNKRTLQDSEVTNGQKDFDNGKGNRDEDASTHAVKKFKLTEDAPQPIVADEFEQESTREVANIPGLQGTSAPDLTEGIVLSHQVNNRFSLPFTSLPSSVIQIRSKPSPPLFFYVFALRSAIKSLYHQTTHMSQFPSMSHQRIPHEHTLSIWILSNVYPSHL